MSFKYTLKAQFLLLPRTGHLKPTATVRCEIVQYGDRLNLKPTLEDIQAALKSMIKAIITSTKNIGKWTEVGRVRNSILNILGVS